MQGWVKHFDDGASEVGADRLVRQHKASWTNGRHKGLIAVDLHWNNKLYTLSMGKGEYWQSDTMVSVFRPNTTVPGEMLTRRISRRLNQDDLGKYICHTRHDSVLRVWLDTESPDSATEVTELLIGKWLILELDTKTESPRIVIQSARK